MDSMPEEPLLWTAWGVTGLRTGHARVCGLDPQGHVVCWGGGEFAYEKPLWERPAKMKEAGLTDFEVGRRRLCALDNDGAPLCFRFTGSHTERVAQPPVPRSVPLRQIAVGERSDCAVSRAGGAGVLGSFARGRGPTARRRRRGPLPRLPGVQSFR